MMQRSSTSGAADMDLLIMELAPTHTGGEIAVMLGMAVSTVRYRAKRLGVPLCGGKWRKFDHEEDQQIIYWARALGPYQIAMKIKRSPSSVQARMAVLKIKRRWK